MTTFALLDGPLTIDSTTPSEVGADHLTGNKCVVLLSYSGSTVEKIIDAAADTLGVDATTTVLSQLTESLWVYKMTDDLVAVTYHYETSTDQIYIRGRSSSAGSTATRYDTNQSGNDDNAIAVLSATQVVACWVHAHNPGSGFISDYLGRVIDVSDSSITLRTTTTMDTMGDGASTNIVKPLDGCNLDSTHVAVLVTLLDGSSTEDGLYISLISVAANVPSIDENKQIVSGSAASYSQGQNSRIVKISTDVCVAVYFDANDSKIKAVKATRSGATLTLGSVVTLWNDTNHTLYDAKLLNTNLILLSYADSSAGKGYIQTLDVTGTPTLGADEFETNATAGKGGELAILSTTRVCFFDTGTFTVSLYSASAPAAAGPYDLLHSLGGIPGGILVP